MVDFMLLFPILLLYCTYMSIILYYIFYFPWSVIGWHNLLDNNGIIIIISKLNSDYNQDSYGIFSDDTSMESVNKPKWSVLLLIASRTVSPRKVVYFYLYLHKLFKRRPTSNNYLPKFTLNAQGLSKSLFNIWTAFKR